MRLNLHKIFLFTTYLLLFTVVIGITYLLYIGSRPVPYAIVADTNSSSKIAIKLQVPEGQTLRHFAELLNQKGWIPEPYSVRVWAALDWPGKSIRTGEYSIGKYDSIRRVLATVINGRTIRYSLTIPEGRNFRQLRALLAAAPHLQHELDSSSNEEIMAQLGHPDEHAEGRFFPDTYHYVAGMKSLPFLRIAYDRMKSILEQAWPQRQPDLAIKTPYQALILASIIEKETAMADERSLISAVFHNRLRKRMRLQTDPTVIYGMGSNFTGNLRRRDLRKDSAYNTYTRYGLPPTPIALPGKQSIMAALQPANSKALYFVAMGNGRHYFSTTLAEHNQAVNRYQRHRGKKIR